MPENRPTKADRREEAKAAAAALRAKQEAAARKQRTLAVVLLVVGLAVVTVIVAFILNQGQGEALAEETPAVSAPRGGVVLDAAGVVAPPEDPVVPGPDGESGTDDDLVWPQGAFGADVVVVSIYSDYMCPWCGVLEESNGALLAELREAGGIVLDVHPVAILDRYANGTAFSTRSSAAAYAVAELAPEAFVEFNATVFANQPAENTDGLSDAELVAFAEQAGAGADVVAAIEAGTYRWWAAQATDLASQDLGSIQTPTILLNGEPLPETLDWRVEGALEAAIDDARG